MLQNNFHHPLGFHLSGTTSFLGWCFNDFSCCAGAQEFKKIFEEAQEKNSSLFAAPTGKSTDVSKEEEAVKDLAKQIKEKVKVENGTDDKWCPRICLIRIHCSLLPPPQSRLSRWLIARIFVVSLVLSSALQGLGSSGQRIIDSLERPHTLESNELTMISWTPIKRLWAARWSRGITERKIGLEMIGAAVLNWRQDGMHVWTGGDVELGALGILS